MNNMHEIIFTFHWGKKTFFFKDFEEAFLHHFNGHRLQARTFDSPAPWLGNAVGNHPKSFTFYVIHCEKCAKDVGEYDQNGYSKYPPMSESEVIKLVNQF